MDKFDCLKVFSRVAQLGSFTAAANELNTTQSAVSKKIAWLEKEIGITLFHRHARAISLTSGGKQYLELAQTLTEQMDSSSRSLDKSKRQSLASSSFQCRVRLAFAYYLRH